MSMGAVDLLAASSSRFPLSFSGALPGAGYRTNVGGTDVAGRGATVGLRFASESGWAGRPDLSFQAAPGGTTQLDRLASWLGVEPWRAGALEYAPVRGEVVPFVTSIDETTNDPTYWRPDLPASVARAIPALVHADGRNGARFRSDLFLYNDNDALTERHARGEAVGLDRRRDDRDADAPPARGEDRPRRAVRRLSPVGRGAAPVHLERDRGRDRRPRHVAHLHRSAGRRDLRSAPAAV